MKLNLVVLKTRDPLELAKFYGHLGITFKNHQHDKGPLHYAADLNDVVFEIYPLPKGTEKADDTLRIGFMVENLEDVLDNLRNSGAKIIKETSLTEWGYVALIEDTDGRKIELTKKTNL